MTHLWRIARTPTWPVLTVFGDLTGVRQQQGRGALKAVHQQSSEEPEYAVPDFYAEDQDALGGSVDLEIER